MGGKKSLGKVDGSEGGITDPQTAKSGIALQQPKLLLQLGPGQIAKKFPDVLSHSNKCNSYYTSLSENFQARASTHNTRCETMVFCNMRLLGSFWLISNGCLSIHMAELCYDTQHVHIAPCGRTLQHQPLDQGPARGTLAAYVPRLITSPSS